MASCFRTVSNRVCCSTYLKPSAIHSDFNNISSSKITPYDDSKKNNQTYQSSSIYLVSNSMYYGNTHAIQLKNVRFPLSKDNLTTQDVLMWNRREAGLMWQFPCVTNETKNCILLAQSSQTNNSQTPTDFGRPSESDLENVFNVLSEDLPKLFVKPISYQIYHQNIILENNIRGNRTVGISRYAYQLALLKAAAHLKFSYVKFIVLKITKHPEEGTIKCRWRIQAVGGLQAFLRFWQFAKKYKNMIDEAPTWYDGFSIYYVGSDGKIFKHVIDKMMPDDDKVVAEKPSITKLAMFLGLASTEEKVTFMNVLNDRFKEYSYVSSVMLPLEKLE